MLPNNEVTMLSIEGHLLKSLGTFEKPLTALERANMLARGLEVVPNVAGHQD